MDNIYQMGFTIKENRKRLDLTQKELAEKLGVSDKAVSKWERCESLPDVTLVPKIAQVLEVSIEYLMTGKDSVQNIKADNVQKTDREKMDEAQSGTAYSSTENAQTASNAARVMHSKINTRYTVCTCILFFILLAGLLEVVVYGYVWWNFQDFICAVLSIAVFAGFYMHIRTKTIMLEGLGAQYTGGADAAAAFTAAGNVLILCFMGVQSKGSISLIDALFGNYKITYNDNNIMYGSTGYGWMLLVLVLFAVVTVNLFISKDRSSFGKNTVAVFVTGAVMSIAHRLFFGFIEEYIVSEEQFLYTFYLERPNAIRIIGNIERYTLIYFAAVAVIGIVAGVVFSKGLRQKLCTAAVMLAFAVYLFVCADKFLGFEAYGKYYAQLTIYGVNGGVILTAALPHIVMIANRFTERSYNNKTEI